MTPEELTELRRWSACDLMGWAKGEYNYPTGPAYHVNSNSSLSYVIRVADWRPDEPNGQIEMVIDKMRELEWGLNLHYRGEKTHCSFSKDFSSFRNLREYTEPRRNAILLAAHAAWLAARAEKEGK
ncbi:MAG: hypothetical protein ABSG90_11715 [Dehalococcoidia bacterium]|jgi:hypothetical protein